MVSFNRLYKNKITILRWKKVEDDYGGVQTKWIKYYWNIICRICDVNTISASTGYKITYEGKEYNITNRIICDKNTDLKEGDRVQDDSDIVYFIVKVKKIFTRTIVHHIEAMASRIEAGIL